MLFLVQTCSCCPVSFLTCCVSLPVDRLLLRPQWLTCSALQVFCVVPEDQVPGTDRPAAAAATAESDAAAAASCSRTLLAGRSSPIPPGAPCPPWSEQSDTPAGGHEDSISSRRTAAAGGRQASGARPHLTSARSLTKKIDLFLHLLREETDHRAESLHEAADREQR